MKKVLIVIFVIAIIVICVAIDMNVFKSRHKIAKWMMSEYGVKSVVISEQNIEDGVKYILKDVDRGFEFSCTRERERFGLDGAVFFHYKTNKSDYYERLTLFLEDEIKEIEQKYGLEFVVPEFSTSGLIEKVVLPITNEADIDFEKTTNAVNELMKCYHLKTISTNASITICLAKEDEYTKYYYPYEANARQTKLHNSDEEFYKNNNISVEMEKELIRYVDEKYGVNCYVENISITPVNVTPRVLTYILEKGDNFRIEFEVDLDAYNRDAKKHVFEKISDYVVREYKY